MATISSRSAERAAEGREGLSLEGPRWAPMGTHQSRVRPCSIFLLPERRRIFIISIKSPPNLQEKSNTAQAPSQPSSPWSMPSLTHPLHTPAPSTGNLPNPWILSYLGFFVPRTSSSLTPSSFHPAPASSVDAPAQNGAVPAPSAAAAALRQAWKSRFPAEDEATG